MNTIIPTPTITICEKHTYDIDADEIITYYEVEASVENDTNGFIVFDSDVDLLRLRDTLTAFINKNNITYPNTHEEESQRN